MESANQSKNNAVTATQLVDVLAFVVERCSAGLDVKDLCSLLQLDSACRMAVLGSRGHFSVTFKASKLLAAAFGIWLRTHAGLVSELRVEDSVRGWQPWSPNDKAARQVGRVLASGLKKCASPAPTPAGLQTAAPSPRPLRLASFSSNARLGPAVLSCLPAMGTTLTRLALDKCWSCVKTTSPAALTQLTSLKELRLRSDSGMWGKYTCDALPCLTALTRLDIGRLVSSDAPAFPPSLLELKLELELGYREPLPLIHDSSSDEDIWGEVDAEKHAELLEAARRLDLSRLPLLRACEMLLSYSEEQLEDFWDHCHQTVTAHLAAPHLTRLLLDGNFCDVEGLQLSCTLQELSLTGCRMPIGRLAQLLSGLPELQYFWYDGKEFVRDLDDWYTEVPNIIPTRQDEAELAAALSGCTKLTTLSIVDLQDRTSSPIPASEADVPGGYVPWIQHLQHMGQLQHLELEVDVSEADAQRLAALTMLTHLRTYSFDAPDSFWDALQKRLTNLQVLDPHTITRVYDW